MDNKNRDDEDKNKNDNDGHQPVKEPPPNEDGGKDLTIEFELPPSKPDGGLKQ